MYRQAGRDLQHLLQLINKGSVKDISDLPGIGKKSLQHIQKLRSENENGITLRNVLAIPGIGSGTLRRLTGNEHVTNVVQFCKYFQDNFEGITKSFTSIISIDVGLSNIAMAQLTPTMEVHSWDFIQFTPPKPYSPKNLYTEVSRLLDCLPLTKDCIFLIEGQSHRTLAGPGAGFNGIGLQLRLIEGMLYGVARERQINAFCVSPKIVAKYFETNRNGKYYQKKQATTLLSCHLVGADGLKQVGTPMGNYLSVRDSLVEQYWRQKKMDDLSDCLLQGISFIEWNDLSSMVW